VETKIYARVEQVCPIASGRYLVFGRTSANSYQVFILNGDTGGIADKFEAYDPVVSPDQHWLVRRDFYSGHSEVPFSEEYLLYDLTRDAAGNTAGTPTPYTEGMRGRVIYPVVADEKPFEHAAYALPEQQMHVFRSNSFYWSSDSRAVLLADSVQDALSLVLLVLYPGGPKAFVHPVVPTEVCEQGPEGNINKETWLMLSQGEVDAKGQIIQAHFRSLDEGDCRPKFLVLSLADFRPAAVEVHPPMLRKGIPVLIQGEPPRKEEK